MNHNYYIINKLEGETPLKSLERLRCEKGIGESVPMTYAGRLDPMAEGLLLVLVGDECKKKDGYLGLDKEYDVEVLLGVGSDAGDVLGVVIPDSNINLRLQDVSSELIQEKIGTLIGKRAEKYPAFSSKPINGKPMFVHARNGDLASFDEDEIPQKEIEIYSIDFLGVEVIKQKELVETAIQRIGKVKGDFRQQEIIESWKDFNLSAANIKRFAIIKLHVNASSGAYMRTLAQKIGELLGTKAIAWKIKRTKIGDYLLRAS